MMTCPTFQIASIKDNRSYNFYSRPVSGGTARRNLDGITDEVPRCPSCPWCPWCWCPRGWRCLCRGGRDKEGYDDDDDDDLCRYLHNITSLCRPPLLPAGWMLTPGLCAATDWWPDWVLLQSVVTRHYHSQHPAPPPPAPCSKDKTLTTIFSFSLLGNVTWRHTGAYGLFKKFWAYRIWGKTCRDGSYEC